MNDPLPPPPLSLLVGRSSPFGLWSPINRSNRQVGGRGRLSVVIKKLAELGHSRKLGHYQMMRHPSCTTLILGIALIFVLPLSANGQVCCNRSLSLRIRATSFEKSVPRRDLRRLPLFVEHSTFKGELCTGGMAFFLI